MVDTELKELRGEIDDITAATVNLKDDFYEFEKKFIPLNYTLDVSSKINTYLSSAFDNLYQVLVLFNELCDAEKKKERPTESLDNEIKHAKIPSIVSSFHGEIWCRCPYCGDTFEARDMQFERGFSRVEGTYYRHNKCGKIVHDV